MNQNPNAPAYDPNNPVLPPEQLLPTAEQTSPPTAYPAETSADGAERQHEKQMEQAPQSPAGNQPPPAMPTAVSPTLPSAAGTAHPAAAADLDVIEQEWVNKIKQIIRDNHDDPHAQEAAFEQVQIDYLKKRHGKDIKATRG